MLGKPTILTFAMAAGICQADIIDDLDSENSPSFVTPARMTSSYFDTPNSVTQLLGADLYLLGINDLVDAMRLVPGMIVRDKHGSSVSIGYHGSNAGIPRRTEVLFNSSPLYRSGYSGVHWHRLSVEVQDTSTIEVIRGSSVIDFGSKAFNSTVNLIQKPIATTQPGATLSNTYGSGDDNETWVEFSDGSENGSVHIRYFHERNNGFDRSLTSDTYDDSSSSDNLLITSEVFIKNNLLLDITLAGNRVEWFYPPVTDVNGNVAQVADGGEDAQVVSRLVGQTKAAEDENLLGVVKLSGNGSVAEKNLSWSTALNFSSYKLDAPVEVCNPAYFFDPDVEALDNSPNIDLDVRDTEIFFGGALIYGVVGLNHSILAPLTDNDLELMSVVGSKFQQAGLSEILKETCGVTDNNVEESKTGIDLQATLEISPESTWASSLSLDETKVKSRAYLGAGQDGEGEVTRTTVLFSNNLRQKWGYRVVSNLGVAVEYDNDSEEPQVSGRTAVNYRLTKNTVLRALYSYSKRSPDIFETRRKWNQHFVFNLGVVDYNGQTGGTLVDTVFSPDSLDPETIQSYELGFTYVAQANRHLFDSKLFLEKMDDLISEPFAYYDFNLTNDGELDLQGIEFSYQYTASRISGLKTGFHYTYLDSETDTPEERTLYARHNGSVWSIIPLAERTHLGLAYYGSTDQSGFNYTRGDVTLSHTFRVGPSDIDMQFNYRNYPDSIASYTEFSPTTPQVISYGHEDRFNITLRLQF